MTRAALTRRFGQRAFIWTLICSYGLAALIVFIWADAWGIIGGPSELGTPLFWLAHLMWLASVIFAFVAFGRRGGWILFGLLALLPGPAVIAALYYACAVNGQCV